MASGDRLPPKHDVLYLFDVDGTLTLSRRTIEPEMLKFLLQLQTKCGVALVGGSDIAKIAEQMGGSQQLEKFDYVFSENGLVAFKNGELIHKESLAKFLGEEKLQKFINFVLRYLSDIELPCKRGTFIEFRNGMLNISPIGRNCSQAERDAFLEYDKTQGIREKMVQVLEKKFADEYKLQFSIGGQISIDVFPIGWNKCYCLRFIENEYKTIHFFGDKTSRGGNDHEIFEDARTIGHTVQNPADTEKQVRALLGMQLSHANDTAKSKSPQPSVTELQAPHVRAVDNHGKI